MKNYKGILLLILASIFAMVLSVGIGSAFISPVECLNIVIYHFTGNSPLMPEVNDINYAILWDIRIPRVMLAFISGAGLSVSGAIMQSILRNPLASSYTLGISSGAALGASTAIFLGVSFLGIFTLPTFGLIGGLLTVFLALGIAVKVDPHLQNNSVILTGMALSLFANSVITMIIAISKEELKQLVFWQMGSFAAKGSDYPTVLFPIVLLGIAVAIILARQMDVMTLGDEQATVSGVNAKKMKVVLVSLSSILAGVVVAMVGVIGFIDLFTPHAARKMFGSSHRYLIPTCALMGGIFMLICDLLARVLVSPIELPVGAITSLFGAPFFIYLYFSKRNKS